MEAMAAGAAALFSWIGGTGGAAAAAGGAAEVGGGVLGGLDLVGGAGMLAGGEGAITAGTAGIGTEAAAGAGAGGLFGGLGGMGNTLLMGGNLLSFLGHSGAGNAQANQAAFNAQAMEAQAQAFRDAAEFNERQTRRKLARLASSQEAAYAASGVDAYSGSPLAVREDTMTQAEMEALAIRYGGALGSARSLAQAEYDRRSGGSSRTAGYLAGGGSLLTGASKFFRPKASLADFME